MMNLALFKKKEKKFITVDGKQIELQPKPGKGIFSFLKMKPSKPAKSQADAAQPKKEQPPSPFTKISVPSAEKEEPRAAGFKLPQRSPPSFGSIFNRQPKPQVQKPPEQPKETSATGQPPGPTYEPPSPPSKPQTMQKTNPWQRYVHNTAIKNRKV